MPEPSTEVGCDKLWPPSRGGSEAIPGADHNKGMEEGGEESVMSLDISDHDQDYGKCFAMRLIAQLWTIKMGEAQVKSFLLRIANSRRASRSANSGLPCRSIER